MSSEVEKIKQIYEKVSNLILLVNNKNEEVEELKIRNEILVESKLKIEAENLELKDEIERLKTDDNSAELTEINEVNEMKIKGMIKEIEECLTLLSS